jgi:3-phosphoshikimate 1-carboxyvinyltransferase
VIVSVNPSSVIGKLHAPPSKSCTQRACAAALINNGTTIIDNAGSSNDEEAAKNIVTKLGATVETIHKQVVITSSKYIFTSPSPEKNVIVSCGESGLSLRMFTPLAALFNYDVTFTGEGSILTRPVDFFDEILPQLGVEIHSNNGKIPITLRGPLQPANITVDGSLSSQFLTGILMAYAKACKVPVSIKVKNLASKPYIDLTLDILKHFGFQVENKNYETFEVYPRVSKENHSIKYTVEGDWSNIAFLLVAGAISGEVTVQGANFNSSQGDKKIIEALEACGASIHIDQKEIRVKKNKLNAFNFDATHAPDLFPPLVALASYCKGTTTIKGVGRLLHKESDRAKTLKLEFSKLNVDIELNDDLMIIRGGQPVKGAKVTSHNDHRIAMACAVAGLGAKGTTIIHGAEAVKKSYPSFYEDLKMVKASLQIS